MELDCRTCGACCVLMSIQDVIKGIPVRKCPALRREGNRVSCITYDIRPQICRDFEKGSAECLALRKRENVNEL